MELEMAKVSELKPHPKNPRIHPDNALEALSKSITEFGWTNPILVSEDGFVLAGYARLKAAEKSGLTEWDFPKLKDLFEELDTGDFGLTMTGFELPEIEDLMTQFHVPEEGLTDDDEIPEKVETICKTGDLWQLGNHRLLNGDATLKEDVERLMGGEKADMVFTDPPYGVAVNQGSKSDLKARHRRTDGKIVQNDELIGDKLSEFLKLAFRNYYIILKEGGSIYVCHAESLGMDVIFRTTFADSGFKPAEIIIWVKDQFAFGRQDYHWRHEPIIYGWKEGAGHYFLDDHTQDTVWEFARPSRSEQHPTMKPVSLCGKAIRNSSQLSGIVADLFGGSGSTLIACEKLGRRCFMMEIDEHYCDVIRTRWEAFTGKEAVKLD